MPFSKHLSVSVLAQNIDACGVRVVDKSGYVHSAPVAVYLNLQMS